MTPRPPSEVSAALRQGKQEVESVDGSRVTHLDLIPHPLMNEAADTIDRLTRELSEARAALTDLDGRYKELIGRAVNAEVDCDGLRADVARKEELRMRANAGRDAAESSCREHAEAIVALRALLVEGQRAMYDYGKAIHLKSVGLTAEAEELRSNSLAWQVKTEATLAATIPALASHLEAERKAERAVVKAARAWADDDAPIVTENDQFLYAAVKALPASPSDKDMGT